MLKNVSHLFDISQRLTDIFYFKSVFETTNERLHGYNLIGDVIYIKNYQDDSEGVYEITSDLIYKENFEFVLGVDEGSDVIFTLELNMNVLNNIENLEIQPNRISLEIYRKGFLFVFDVFSDIHHYTFKTLLKHNEWGR